MLNFLGKVYKHKYFYIIYNFLIVFLVFFLFLINLFLGFDMLAYNYFMRLRGQIFKDRDKIVIVAIDEKTEQKIGSWPFKRDIHSKMLDNLSKAKPSIIGIDIVFSEKKEGDKQFAASIKKAGNVIGARYMTPEGNIVASNNTLGNEFLGEGCINMPNDLDSFVRRLPLLYLKQSKGTASTSLNLGLEILRHYLNITSLDTSLKNNFKLGNINIPYYGGSTFINFVGPPKSFKYISYWDIYKGSFDYKYIKDKIVLIGPSTPTIQDIKFVPFSKCSDVKVSEAMKKHNIIKQVAALPMPGVEVHANFIHTILTQNFIKKFSNNLLFCLMLFFSLIIGIIIQPQKNQKLNAFLMVFFVIVIYLLGLFSFNKGYFIPITSFLMILFINYVNSVFQRVLIEQRKKAYVTSLFGRYVSPEIVKKILSNPDHIALGGKKQELTVFFSDVRSFTTYSETHTPEEVVAILNEYLTAMTEIIFECGGTLDKFVGDEIMAIWGSPIPQENHAELAVRAAWKMLAKLRELQKKWEEEGTQPIDIGMGINTGPMVVGNIGAPSHMDYTVIGDAVNLGARIEALTREYNNYFIISEFTYEKVKDIVKVKELGDVVVKGKNKPVKIYDVLDVKN